MFVEASQLDLFASEADAPARAGTARPVDLGEGAWFDFEPNWLAGADHWFDEIAAAGSWRADSRPMYDRIVAVPRLVWYDRCEAILAAVPRLRGLLAAVEERYGMRFPSVSANWYRDGNDSVAPHADKVPNRKSAHIAIVSFGDRRPFTLRHAGGGPARRFELGHGDLMTMGGTTQAAWHHAVPKVRAAGPRISVMFRDSLRMS